MTNVADIQLEPYPVSEATTARLRAGFFGHVIEGDVVPSVSGETFPVFDPSNGNHVADAALAGPEDVERAVA